MSDVVDSRTPLEAQLKDEIVRIYSEVAEPPERGFRFRRDSTRNAAEAYGVEAVMMTALEPAAG